MLSHYFLLKVMSATVTFLMSSVFLNCVLSLFPLVLRKQSIFGICFIQVILFIESIEFIDSFCIYLEIQIYVNFSKSQRFEFPNVFVNLSATKAEK